MLTVKIQKQYGSFMLDVDFAAGSVLALLGASGSGKSVTLKCAAGIDRPDRGKIELDGRVLFDSEKRIDLPPQKRKIGYLFQQYALFPHMTVEQNIAVCLRKNPRRQARTEELLAMFQLEDAAKLLPRQLSGGQQQRTALARILASEPDALLLDEPFAALDSHLKWQLEQELQDVLERFHGPVVWVSHDRGEVYRNCRRVCVLDHGKSSPAAALRDWMADPVTVCAARLSGCRNCVPARPGPGGIFIPDWGLTLRHAAPWRKNVTAAGIRAEQIYPARAEDVNAFLCRTVRVSEDFSVMLAALRPESAAPGAPLLQMEVRKEIWAALPCRDRFWAAVRPEDVLLLE